MKITVNESNYIQFYTKIGIYTNVNIKPYVVYGQMY